MPVVLDGVGEWLTLPLVIRFTDIGGGGGEASEANALVCRDRL